MNKSSDDPSAGPASVTIQRRVEWVDTDAAGVYHWLTAFRLVEAAEAELHDRLGLRAETFGRMPRAHVDADFRTPLRFFDVVEVELRVTRVGRTSVGYAFSLRSDGQVAVEGTLVTVLVDRSFTGGGITIPDAYRRPLLTGGVL